MTETSHANIHLLGAVWEAFNRLPTVTIGQEHDLKLERDGLRIWLSRVVDGELTIEVFLDNNWREVWRGSVL